MARIASLLVAPGLALAIIAPGALQAKSSKHRHLRPAAVHEQQVACTVLGCETIPAACYPKEEHTSGGIPTGFDQIICPPGVWPF
jgi:hypothetical protein